MGVLVFCCEAITLNSDTLEDASLLAECTTDSDGNNLKIGGWTHHNINYSYHTPWDGTVTLGINNVNDKMPPLASDGSTFSTALYPHVGRQYVFQYQQRF